MMEGECQIRWWTSFR